MHGTNVVYKHAPYIAYPDPGKPWNFSSADAAKMQSLGFNLVRLGIEWQALEPGSGGPNQPGICTPGPPGNSHEFNLAVADRYLAHVAATVKLLSRYGIYTLLDMHQDVYNKNFRGEGAPDWAVCTDGVPIVASGGRWSSNYSNPQLDTAVHHFWTNDVVGNLQGQYDLVWATVANYFKSDPWVVGYDPYNEPFSTETQTAAGSTFTGNLECFYTGEAAHRVPGQRGHTTGVPLRRAEQRGDPLHPGGGPPPPDLLGTGHLLGHRRATSLRSWARCRSSGSSSTSTSTAVIGVPVTGNPIDLLQCLQSEETAASEQDITRLSMSSQYQSSGPAIFMSEFGATTSLALAGFDTEWAGLNQVGWAYWAWKYYDDPTGVLGRGPRPARRGLLADRERLVADVPAGGRGSRELRHLQPLHRVLQHDVHTQPLGPGVRRSSMSRRPALSGRVVRSSQGREDHLEYRCDASRHCDHRAPAAGLCLGDGGSVPLS